METIDVDRLAAAYLFIECNGWLSKAADNHFNPEGRTPEDRWRVYAREVAEMLVHQYGRTEPVPA